MVNFLISILNYVWVLIKLFFICVLFSLPIIGIIYLFKGLFRKIKKKHSFSLSLFSSIFIVTYPILLIIYFIPVLSQYNELLFLEIIGLTLFQIVRLILVNLLFSAILFIFGLFVSLLYDSNLEKIKKSKKKKEINFFALWKNTAIVLFVMITFVLLVFPRLPAIILYLIYM